MTLTTLLALNLAIPAHLVGDYVLQSHVMATRKTTSWTWAAIHAAFYSLPFAALLFVLAPERALPALAIIGGTHAVIDRLAIARRWCVWYGVGFPGIWFDLVALSYRMRGYRPVGPRPPFDAPPPFLGVWLIILVDQAFHLCINAAAIGWAA